LVQKQKKINQYFYYHFYNTNSIFYTKIVDLEEFTFK